MDKKEKSLREEVYRANIELWKSGLVLYTFGNVSGVDRERGIMYIKPSGVPYEKLKPQSLVPVSLATGKTLGNTLNPSSDTATHVVLYRAFACGGIAHTHSAYATAFAQARMPIPCGGTTHADHFFGDVPVTRPLTRREVASGYEAHTGDVIVETFKRLDPAAMQAVLVALHGPFAWGTDAADAVHNAVIIEFCARVEFTARLAGTTPPALPRFMLEKHFFRKHGKQAYYGQKRGKA